MGMRQLVCALVIVTCAFETAALADTNAAGTFNGVAEIGEWFTTPCTKTGIAEVTGRGLYLPGTVTVPGLMNGDDTRQENGVWRFSSGGSAVGTTQAGPFAGPFTIHACGYLGPVADPGLSSTDGIGANCAMFKGHHGQGQVVFANGQRLKLFDVHWSFSVGSGHPVRGKYQEYADDDGDPRVATKKDKTGAFVGYILASGGAGCLGLKNPSTNNGNGAQALTIQGKVSWVNALAGAGSSPPQAFDKRCAGVGPEAGVGPDGKKSNQNKPADGSCDGGDQ